MSPHCLNLIGLIVSMIAAGVMYFFPFYTTPITEDKKTGEMAEVYRWTNAGKVNRWKLTLAKVGPILLAIGFLLQIIAALM
jgi:hypothetical protein